jgi:methionine sulfoxide reductase heme-binding subunit
MTVTWLIVRASGLVAYGLLAAASIWGLVLSTRLLGRRVPAKALTFTHEGLSLGGLAALATHLAFVAFDDYLGFGWREILLPGAASWRPQAVALGVVGAWGMAVVGLSFYVRRFIGQKAWRYLHFGAFGTYVAATAHGIMAGSDTTRPGVLALYAASAAAVLILVIARVVLAGEKARPRVAPAPVRSMVPSAPRARGETAPAPQEG